MIRKTKRSSLDRRALILWSLIIRAPGRCARCHRTAQTLENSGLRLEAAHIIRRARSRNTRWHLRGGIPLCGPYPGSCHYWLDNQANELEAAEFVISIVGRETYDELHRIKNEPWDKDYGPVLAGLHAEMKRLGLKLP